MPSTPEKTPKPKRSHKAKNASVGWTFTYYSVDPPLYDPRKLRCMIYQREICPETGNHHWQGALRTEDHHGLNRKSIVKLFPNGIHDNALQKSRAPWQKNFEYCSKIETRIPGTEPTVLGNPPKFGSALAAAKVNHNALILDELKSGTPMADILTNLPNSLPMLGNMLKAREILNVPIIVPRPMSDFILPNSLVPGKCLVIVGETDLAKTAFALAHFKHPLFISHIDGLKKYVSSYHDGIVFDDMSFTHWETTHQIHLVDSEYPREIHSRYYNGWIPANTPKIFTCNKHPFTNDPAINRRIVTLNVTESLIK